MERFNPVPDFIIDGDEPVRMSEADWTKPFGGNEELKTKAQREEARRKRETAALREDGYI